MTDKEKLYYLINEFFAGNYDAETFSDLFTVQYNTDTDYDELSEIENRLFDELSHITSRFSSDVEDLRIPNLYYDESKVRKCVMEVIENLKI